MKQPNPDQFTTEDTESKAFLRALRALRGELKTTPSPQPKKLTAKDAKDAKNGKNETEKPNDDFIWAHLKNGTGHAANSGVERASRPLTAKPPDRVARASCPWTA
ncbi:MAG: hypothetical protein LBM04_02065, partial [Opitutaceae bacterium]|nr:hypothetical protein [Opitutaceae bacterium]